MSAATNLTTDLKAPSPQVASPTVVSLGCRLNIAESERMKAMLADEGDIVVINSCAVTSEAVRQTRQAIRRARRDRPQARLIVTGCAADIERDAIAAMPEVDGLIANETKLDPRAWNAPIEQAPLPPTRTRAFVAVQNGCDHACTFCVIPQGRGKSRSLAVGEVLRQIRVHLDQGAKEVVLTGVDLTSWGQDFAMQQGLGALVEAILAAFPQLARLRLSSVDGVEIDEALFDLIAHEPRVMPHLHLSLQHGHDLILKRMKRRHSRADAIDLVARLRAARPDIAVGADLIAGFPTETEEHHAANLAIIDDLDIVHGHIFPYSPRPGTPAARMPQIERARIKARAAQLRAAVAARRARWLSGFVGETLGVLAERDGTGYSPGYARVACPPGARAGEIIAVTVREVDGGLLR
ncbi:MAG: tRNA (N(6)-L-threonylcarbamoyladenosine(37)-C(2))-methylthiotransferase MtaB [Pseudomonadota bacterium]